MPMSTITSPSDDPLSSSPPAPNARSAKRSSSPAMPKLNTGSADGIAHLLGGGGGGTIAAVMGDVMEIDKRIRSLAQVRPDIAQLFAPVLAQARDMLAGSMADLAQGGTGMPGQDTIPPPAAAAGGMGGPGAGSGGPGGMMPPPPV